jgi:hypothetical protein
MTVTESNETLSAADIIDLSKRHTIFSWSAQGALNPIAMVRGEGVHFWDAEGKRYIDMNSQLMCVNIGHGNKRVIEAIKRQADELVYAGPGMATPVRARLGRMLAESRWCGGQRKRDPHRAHGHGSSEDHGSLPFVPRRDARRDQPDRRSASLAK